MTIDRTLESFIVGLFLFFVALTFVQVVLRYVFSSSILWADEMSRYMFIWMVLLAAGLVVGKGKHIRIEILNTFISDSFKRLLLYISDVSIIIFSVFLIIYGWNIVKISSTALSPATQIPMSYFQMIFLIFGFVSIYRALIHVILLTKTRDTEID